MENRAHRKQTSIAALSNVAILNDPTLVEDLSELRSVPRFSSDETDQSVSGSVVVTKDTPSTEKQSVALGNYNNNSKNQNNGKSGYQISPQKSSRITSMTSSHYSEEEEEETERQEDYKNHDNNNIQYSNNDNTNNNYDNTTIGENSPDMGEEDTDRDMSIGDAHTPTIEESEEEEKYDNDESDSIKPLNHSVTDTLNDLPITDSDRDKAVESGDNLNMDYSDSDFEDKLEERVLGLDIDHYGISMGEGHCIDNTNNKKTSSSSQGLEFEISDDDNDNYEDAEDEDAEDEEEYQPLPPPQELDPDKLYALYAFDGPDQSHCKLEQDEACILLNDEDAYWWLVKRCSDNNIGFAPAEILETFPERLARLNCWKNENMTSSTINSIQSIEEINKIEKLQQEEQRKNQRASSRERSYDRGEEDEKITTEEAKKEEDNSQSETGDALLHAPYKGKTDKSVSFNDIVSYAERYIETSGTDDSNNSKDDTSDISDTADENVHDKTSKHYDEFSSEIVRFNDEKDADEISEVVSDVSFSTGYAQPLNVKKIRESKSIKNIHDEVSPSTREYLSDIIAEDEGKTIKRNLSTTIHNYNYHNNEAHQDNDGVHLVFQEEPKSAASKSLATESLDDLEKVFEAPIIPFAKAKSQEASKIKNSTSDYSISTIGEFSPSSSEWTNDSPNLNGNDNHETFEIEESVNETIPSSHAIQNISQLVDETVSRDDITSVSVIQDDFNDTTLENKETHVDNHSASMSCGSNDDSQSSHSKKSSLADEDFRLYADPQHLQASITSITPNASTNKIHHSEHIMNLDHDVSSDRQLTPSYSPSAAVATAATATAIKRSSSETTQEQHPFIRDMYNPILSQIDTLMARINEIIEE